MMATELLELALYRILLNLTAPSQNKEDFRMNFNKPGCVKVVANVSYMINPSVFSHWIFIDGSRTYSIQRGNQPAVSVPEEYLFEEVSKYFLKPKQC